MKKKVKNDQMPRLLVSTETVRDLSNRDLKTVAGGLANATEACPASHTTHA